LVPHKRLLVKPKSYGFYNKMILWIENFLKEINESQS